MMTFGGLLEHWSVELLDMIELTRLGSRTCGSRTGGGIAGATGRPDGDDGEDGDLDERGCWC